MSALARGVISGGRMAVLCAAHRRWTGAMGCGGCWKQSCAVTAARPGSGAGCIAICP